MVFILLIQQLLSAYNISCCGLEAVNTIPSKASFPVPSENSLRGSLTLRNGECSSVMNTIFETRQKLKTKSKNNKSERGEALKLYDTQRLSSLVRHFSFITCPTTSVIDRVLLIATG